MSNKFTSLTLNFRKLRLSVDLNYKFSLNTYITINLNGIINNNLDLIIVIAISNF